MCVHGSQALYCTTELCLSVDKLKEEKNKKEGTMLVYRDPCLRSVHSVNCKTENTYTPS